MRFARYAAHEETIIANVGGEFELASHAGFNITEDHGHEKGRQAEADALPMPKCPTYLGAR